MTAVKSVPVVVVAPIVVVETNAGHRREMYAGDVIGADVKASSVDHLRSIGFVK